jgi:hypothetical protein
MFVYKYIFVDGDKRHDDLADLIAVEMDQRRRL